VLLWGVLALLIPPWEPFAIVDVGHTVGSAAFLAYLVRGRARPNRKIVEAICAILIAYALILLPWTTVVWCQLGRPVEAFTVPQAAVVSIALVVPARWKFGIAAVCMFFAESLFAYFYARHVGLDALIPVTEPMATVSFGALGIGIFFLRRQRLDRVRQHIRVQAELQALQGIRPHFEHASDQLGTQIATLAGELAVLGDARSTIASRAVGRLADLRGKLADLIAADDNEFSPRDVETRMLEHDAQFGAILLTGLMVTVAFPISVWMHEQAGDSVTLGIIAPFFVALPTLLILVITRDRPSSRRALLATLALVAIALPLITYNQYWLRELGRPYAPFLGHKLFMGILGLTLATRLRIGVVLIVTVAATAIVTWFVLGLNARHDMIVYAEPWMTLIYMLIGLASLSIREERQIASIQLLRAQTEASAMRRRALMFLALRDRLNSPLQTLALGVPFDLPTRNGERAQMAVDGLVALSHELADLDVLIPDVAATFDADLELQRQA
jgi:hypothetical protein